MLEYTLLEKYMKNPVTILICVFIFRTISFSQDYNLSGIVTNYEGKPLDSVDILLKKADIHTRTDSTGYFHITASTVRSEDSESQNSVLFVMNRSIYFRVKQDNEYVKIGMYNLKGQQVHELFEGRLSKGLYDINPSTKIGDLSHTWYCLRIILGKSMHSLVVYNVNQSHSDYVISKRNTISAHKTVAVATIDTLEIKKENYQQRKLTIAYYSDNIDTIRLFPACVDSFKLQDNVISGLVHDTSSEYMICYGNELIDVINGAALSYLYDTNQVSFIQRMLYDSTSFSFMTMCMKDSATAAAIYYDKRNLLSNPVNINGIDDGTGIMSLTSYYAMLLCHFSNYYFEVNVSPSLINVDEIFDQLLAHFRDKSATTCIIEQ